MTEGIIVTVSREAYCGGDELARMLADKTGFKFYDREIISLASQKSGIHEEHFESVEKKPTNSILYSVVMGMYSSRGAYVKLDDVLTDDKIYKVQADIIRDMAAQGNCVFVGRCSDYILRNNEKCFNIFLRGNLDDRVKRVMSEQNTSEAEAKKIVSRADKKRRSYYNYYTNREWGNINNYDIALNLSTISETDAVDVIINYLEKV
ncbi:MAG: cytidylate kinase-like family protein [Clostridia bacterium]|nr:cytidylate kinase-like family protein [Clostridia bacterium]